MNNTSPIEARKALEVFEKIVEHGERRDDDWVFDQMSANSGYDGYTVTLSDHHGSLTVNFHNTLHFDCDSSKALQAFIEHIERIYRLPVAEKRSNKHE